MLGGQGAADGSYTDRLQQTRGDLVACHTGRHHRKLFYSLSLLLSMFSLARPPARPPTHILSPLLPLHHPPAARTSTHRDLSWEIPGRGGGTGPPCDEMLETDRPITAGGFLLLHLQISQSTQPADQAPSSSLSAALSRVPHLSLPSLR